jgi:hypothetical protein
MKSKRKAFQPARVTVPIFLEEVLNEKVTATAKELDLTKQAVIQMSLERGLSILDAQLPTKPA